MKLQKVLSNSVEVREVKMSTHSPKQQLEQQKVESENMTPGQRLADSLASKVGSWPFLIGQTSVLTAWVGLNLMPGVPHWDQSPFILLNLVFSFASAYTAPIVLMSQNRQSDIERKKAEYNHLVNLKAGGDIELLHEKIDSLQAQQLKELIEIVKDQQRSLNEMKASALPAFKEQPQDLKEVKLTVLPGLKEQPQYLNEVKPAVFSELNEKSQYFNGIKLSDDQFLNRYTGSISFNLNPPMENTSKVADESLRHSA